jgi:hypothetical protein
LLQGFRFAFEARRRLPWLGEGFDRGDLVKNLRGAIGSALSFCGAPTGLVPSERVNVDSEFLVAFGAAAETLDDATIEAYFNALRHHGVSADDQHSIERLVEGALENYVRNKDNGLTADPW